MADHPFPAGDQNLTLSINESTTEVSLKDSAGEVLANYKNGEKWVPVDGNKLIYAGGSTVNEYVTNQESDLIRMVNNEIENLSRDKRKAFSAENSQFDPYRTKTKTEGFKESASETLSGISKASYPSDPEPLFYGRYPLNQTDHNCDCIPGGNAFPVALDNLYCNRFEMAEFAKQCADKKINFIGICCGAEPHHVREMSVALGRKPISYKYYPDISRHWLHGKDESFLELNTSMSKKY